MAPLMHEPAAQLNGDQAKAISKQPVKAEVNATTDQMQKLRGDARDLIERLHASFDTKYGLSTTSCQIYDTAWIAMIAKEVGSHKEWLFPESFYYILRQQADDGSWGFMAGSKTVGVIDTGAALLALLRHAAEPLQIRDVSNRDLQWRIQRAILSLERQLKSWDDLESTNHIAVEMTVPALLNYLEEHDSSLTFDFELKSTLLRIRDVKLDNFQPSKLYGQKPSSILHSLEAFISVIDFDQVKHHLHNGSMMASPSSTAAYLMHASQWDDEAEGYLRHVAQHGSGHGDGGIPGTFPTTYFEFSWVISTLIRSGFTVQDLDSDDLQAILSLLLRGFMEDHGVVGFAPRAIDVDDTAKALLALHLNNHHGVNAQMMVKIFEGENHFNTFGAERDPSLSSNCHVLIVLLQQRDVSAYVSQIWKAASFVCDFWWNADEVCKDKWHLSHLYPTMLMVEGFVDLLQNVHNGEVSSIGRETLLDQIRICVGQAIIRTLLEQSSNGSWNDMPEQTAYAVLTLSHVQHIGFLHGLNPATKTAILNAGAFLNNPDRFKKECNWTSKIAYSVTFVAEAYTLAAHRVVQSCADYIPQNVLPSENRIPDLLHYCKLVKSTPLFADVPEWELQASLIESALFVPLLRSRRSDVFARNNARFEKDKYIDIIPFTWVGCSNRSKANASTSWLYDMMLLSMFGYQVDEFMEGDMAAAHADDLHMIHDLIDQALRNVSSKQQKWLPPLVHGQTEEVRKSNEAVGNEDRETAFRASLITLDHPALVDKQCVLGSEPTVEIGSDSSAACIRALEVFVGHVLCHPRILSASVWDRNILSLELRNFLHAHAAQIEDNSRFGKQDNHEDFVSPRKNYFQWVRNEAADHVACAYSFAFACCLLSTRIARGHATFRTVTEKYLAAAAARHLTTMCRMYNDVGSISRDTKERNLNSVHFPEFTDNGDQTRRRAALLFLAEYEHLQLDSTLTRLKTEMHAQTADGADPTAARRIFAIVSLFCDVTVLYDQLYVVQDLSSAFKA